MRNDNRAEVHRPNEVRWPTHAREKYQHRHAHADFRNDDRHRHRAFDRALEGKAKAPKHDCRQRAQNQTENGGKKCDGQ